MNPSPVLTRLSAAYLPSAISASLAKPLLPIGAAAASKTAHAHFCKLFGCPSASACDGRGCHPSSLTPTTSIQQSRPANAGTSPQQGVPTSETSTHTSSFALPTWCKETACISWNPFPECGRPASNALLFQVRRPSDSRRPRPRIARAMRLGMKTAEK